jgi:aconitate hydratase
LSFARIHWQNLINFGVLPLTFKSSGDLAKIKVGDELQISGIHEALKKSHSMRCLNLATSETYALEHELTSRQLDVFLQGGLIFWMKQRLH